MTQRIGIPVATCLFPGALTPAIECEVIPPDPIALRKDIFVVCAPRDLNGLPFASLREPELDPTVFTVGAEDLRDTDLWRGGGRRRRRLRTEFRSDFFFLCLLCSDEQRDRLASLGF